ncbi:hypothetical protein GCM10027287_13100 [Bordetella muralis]
MLSRREAAFNEVFNAVQAHDPQALAEALDDSSFDLASFEQEKGHTILHLAISLGYDDIAMMVLQRAGNNAKVINAKDRQGYTPLMAAAAMRNVGLMKTLVDSGALVNDGITRSQDGGHIQAESAAATAQLLIDVDGNIPDAFGRAVFHQNRAAAKLYFDADALSIVQSNADHLGQLIHHGYIQTDDVHTCLDRAMQCGNQAACNALTRPDVVLSVLVAMSNCPETEKIATLTNFMSAGADTTSWVGNAVTRCVLNADKSRDPEERVWVDAAMNWRDLEILRLVIAVGAPTIPELVRLGEHGDLVMAQRLISFGADAIGAMETLRATNEQAANVVAYAALKGVLDKADLPEEEKLRRLMALMLEADRAVVGLLIADELNAGAHAAVTLLGMAEAMLWED